jgi:hypothetical protein
LAVLPDGSVLVGDRQNERLLRIHQGQVQPGPGEAVHRTRPLAPGRMAVLPDGTVLVLHQGSQLLRVSDRGVHLLLGADEGHFPLDRHHCPGPGPRDLLDVAALPDGSALLTSFDGLWCLSPPDQLQTTLEGLVEQARAALALQDREACQAVTRELARLAKPARATQRAVNRAARDGFRLEPPDLAPSLHRSGPVLEQVAALAGNTPAERLRALSALKEVQWLRALAFQPPPGPESD